MLPLPRPCHRCQQFPSVFVHDDAAYLEGNRECVTCGSIVERFDKPDRAITRWNHMVSRKEHAHNGHGVRIVSAETYRKAKESAINLGTGPCGHDGGVIHIHMPVYGLVGLYVECPYCKARTAVYSISEGFVDNENGMITTPFTVPAIVESMKLAVQEWNQGHTN